MSCEEDEKGNNNSVKRNLFGEVDHAKIRDDLNKQLALSLQEKKRHWNFDFEEFKPLDGRYKWERVGKRLTHIPTANHTQSCATSSQFNTEEKQEGRRYDLRERVSEKHRQIDPRHIFKPHKKRPQACSASQLKGETVGIYKKMAKYLASFFKYYTVKVFTLLFVFFLQTQVQRQGS